MSDEAIDLLRPMLREKRFRAKEFLITQGAPCHEVYAIRSGVARNFSLYDGKEYTRWFALDGDLFTSGFAFAHNQPAMASVEAMTEMDVLTADIKDVKTLIEKSHEWARWAFRYLLEGVYVLERRHVFLKHGDAYTRYVKLISVRSFDMLNSIPLKHIASYLNITQQTLCRIRRKIARENLNKKGGG